MKKQISLWAFLLVGLAVAAWAAASWISPSPTCRGVEMGPGDTCEYAAPNQARAGQVQTYEERVETVTRQAPVGVVVGLGAAGFGVYVIVKDARQRREQEQESSTPA